MDLFTLVTPIIYWILIVCWLYILFFYLKRIKSKIYEDRMIVTLLIILSIDSLRTVIESSYFGAWYTSLAGLIPIDVFNTLAQPHLVFFPKALNLLAALLVIFILIRKWIPEENQRIQDLTKTVKKQKLSYNNLLNSMQDVLIAVDQDWIITDANQAVLQQQFGYDKEEIINKNFEILLGLGQTSFNPVDLKVLTSERGILKKLSEMEFRKKSGEMFLSEIFISEICSDPDDSIGYLIVIRDITERKEAVKALRESEQKYRILIENLPQKINYRNRNSEFVTCNVNFADEFKISPEEVIGKTDFDFYPKELAQKYRSDDKRIMLTGGTEEIVEEHIQDGKKITVQAVKTAVFNDKGAVIGLLCIYWDITERKQAEDQIKVNLKDKETLLHEIHHRVKNNMQVINSLLKLQSNSIDDVKTKEILKNCQSRIYAMSAVHETLHGSEKLSEIDLKTYLSKITASIFQTYAIDHRKIKLNSSVDNSPISINQAYPLGLIINELISNSIKYAFPGDSEGEVSVSLKKQDQELELILMDNGVGMPNELEWDKAKTLGLKLVRTLVENQLGGSIDRDKINGTKFNIKFNIET